MPRTSRKNNDVTKKEVLSSVYQACIYTRLSRERTEEWRNKSGSIESQIEICQSYLNKANIPVKKIYTDYEYSGTNFERPGYQEMMNDIRNGLVNCIIIRDLSRLGREHLEMGRLVDKVFPFLGVRFISVVDKIDTAKGIDARLSFEMLIKNLINDMYAKDISQKVKSSKHNKARKGFFIGSNPPFGYKIVNKDSGRKLEPDDISRQIILQIFEMYNSGIGVYNIAKYLNDNNIATSLAYYKTKDINRREGDPKWRKGTIINMLKNKTYIGHLIQGTKSTGNGKRNGFYEKKPEDEWIVVENNHEAIIPEDLFYSVQKRIEENSKKDYFKITCDLERDPINRYKGLIYDGNTGLTLKRRGVKSYRRNYNGYYYKFTNREYIGYKEEGEYISILEEKIDEMVMSSLKQAVGFEQNGTNTKNRIQELLDIELDSIISKEKRINLKMDKLNYDMKEAYERYSLDEIKREEYIDIRRSIREKLSSFELTLNDLDKERRRIQKKAKDEIKILNSISKQKENKISEKVIKQHIERIDVYSNSDIRVRLKIVNEGGEYCE